MSKLNWLLAQMAQARQEVESWDKSKQTLMRLAATSGRSEIRTLVEKRPLTNDGTVKVQEQKKK